MMSGIKHDIDVNNRTKTEEELGLGLGHVLHGWRIRIEEGDKKEGG